MTDVRNTRNRRRRPERLIDPYVVVPHTWTREDLLRTRAEHAAVEVVQLHAPSAA
jgi:hypothetical protein